MRKSLEDIKVTQMDSTLFATNEKLYRFSRKGLPIINLPHGSLIYTGEKKKGPGGFPHAVFGVWKGKEEIEERKLVFIKQDKVLEKHKTNGKNNESK